MPKELEGSFEVSVIEEKSAKIEEQERMITTLYKSLVNSQNDV